MATFVRKQTSICLLCRSLNAQPHPATLGRERSYSSREIYSVFDFDVQEPLAYARGTATATVRERPNTQVENALD
jgi:hypothetical protein